MTILCLGALLAGLLAAAALPFPAFALALLGATLIGSAWAGFGGATLGSIALSAFVLLLACQIGYGIGIALAALLGPAVASRRGAGEKTASAPTRPLRTGNEPS